MAKRNGKDLLYLIWKSFKTRNQYIVGELVKNGQYEFSYGIEIEKAREEGFEWIICFPDLNKVYKNDILFPIFSTRLPDKKRKDIDKILEKYNMNEYDAYTLLKKSRAKLPIDNFEFIDPILEIEQESIKREFVLAGSRHYIGCKGEDCSKSMDVLEGEKLFLNREPANEYDCYAIQIVNNQNELLGYVPRYYSESVTTLIESGAEVVCSVSEVIKDGDCSDCIRVLLEIKN